MVDRYTKLVLTVVAAALVAITAQNFVRPASAQLGEGCGDFRTPCHVTADVALPVLEQAPRY